MSSTGSSDRYLIGYVDQPFVYPGATVELKASTTEPEFDFRIVRLVYGDTDPDGPGLITTPVDDIASGSVTGREQYAQCGSYAEVPLAGLGAPSGFTLDVHVLSTLRDTDTQQVVAEIIDLDVQAFFDSVPWTLIIKSVEAVTDAAWVLLYVKRWLAAPLQHPDGTLIEREKGTPQGSLCAAAHNEPYEQRCA